MLKLVFLLFSILNSYAEKDFSYYLTDPKDLVDNNFKIHSSIKKRTKFWFDIYTKYNSDTAVIHDTHDLSLVYSTIDTSKIDNKILNYSIRYKVIKQYRRKFLNNYKKALQSLSNRKCSSQYCKQVLVALRKADIKIPQGFRLRKKFFLKLKKTIRTQTGQKDKIIAGIKNIEVYKSKLDSIIKAHKLPKDLLAIALLESSFNLKARSKVDAQGPWQFMRRVGKSFMKIDRSIDQRNNPFLSTSAALHLLKQNKKILKHWDLAINAYNSGTGNIRKGLSKLKNLGYKNPKAHHLINKFKSRSYRFASRNFYPEFLALAHILPYKNLIYRFKKKKVRRKIRTFVTKCKFKAKKYLSRMRTSQYNINEVNNHLNKKYLSYPQGTVVFSDVKLSKRKYLEIKDFNFKKYYPKKMYKLANNQKCSTK